MDKDMGILARTIIDGSDEDLTKENANMNGESFAGRLNKMGSEFAKKYAMDEVLPKELTTAIKENYVYVHDLDYYAVGATNCIFIPFDKVLKDGFQTSNGLVREPQSIMTACALVAVIFQIQQNSQYGGVSANKIDWDLAPYVAKTFVKYFKKGQALFSEKSLFLDHHMYMGNNNLSEKCPRSFSYAMSETREETKQAMESLIHNLNTMHSRPGGQVPFTSVNYGMCTSEEGRLVTYYLIEATIRGVGNGTTPIFPQHIFQCKKEVNIEKGSPNHDLFLKAIECSSKRLYPNFVNVDAPFNLKYYKEEDPNTIVATMGCRTRTIGNMHGEEGQAGRGNLSFNTINLVRIAITSPSLAHFYNKLDECMDIAMRGLLHRYEIQAKQKAKASDFMMREGVWLDGDSLSSEEEVRKVLIHGTLAIGFIGLAEALKSLLGSHHGESSDSLATGLAIIKYMSMKCNAYSTIHQMNVSLFATPAEGLSGKFTKQDKKDFGVLAGVTDREYYTNSFHVPVYYSIGISNKINIEAPFHEYCTAGAISYVEINGNARNNKKSFGDIVKYALNSNVGYFSINHPVDGCPKCGYEGIIGKECPGCGAHESNTKFNRLRRVTGYITGNFEERFNSAKQAEVRDRVIHR